MFIELTDLLRCPGDHEEAFLVLIPDEMAGRRVVAGHLGCPVCGWTTAWTDGVPRLDGSGPAATPPPPPAFDATAAVALLGLSGPGGWLALAGRAGSLAGALESLLPGVHVVAINPPPAVGTGGAVSVIRAARWPLKRQMLRGAVVGADAAAFVADAIASVLPGLAVVGEGTPPAESPGHELVAAAPEAWVVRRR